VAAHPEDGAPRPVFADRLVGQGDGGRAGVDRDSKEALVSEVRERLRTTLLQLLGGQTVGPAADYIVRRTQLLRQHADDVLEVRDRATRVRAELIAGEVRVMVTDGFSPGLA